MSRLAALIIGVAAAQPDIDAAACRRPTYPGPRRDRARRELAPRLRAAGADGARVLPVVRAPRPLQRRHRRGSGRRRPPVSGPVSFLISEPLGLNLWVLSWRAWLGSFTAANMSPNVQAKYSARTEPSDSVAKNAKKASAFAVSVRGRRGAGELAPWALVNTLTAHRGSLPLRASAAHQDAHFGAMPASPGLPQPKAKPR